MKLAIVAPATGNIIANDQAIDVTVRMTHDNGLPARNVSLSWRPVARHGQWAQRFTTTDKKGIARNSLTFSGDAQPGAYRIEVSTPGNDLHAIGGIHVLPNQNAVFTPKRAEAVADAGTLTIVYPPQNVLLPVNSPIKVWALYANGNQGLGNQPIQFTKGDNTNFIGAPDTTTDADGWATAVVQLTKVGTLGTIATFDGSITASIPQTNISTTQPLHASTSAGGPGTISVTRLEWKSLVPNKIGSCIEMQHLLADGTPGEYAHVKTEPTAGDGQNNTYFLTSSLQADGVGVIENAIFTTLQQGDTINSNNVDVTASNVIAGANDTANINLPVANLNGNPPTSIIEVGPIGEGMADILPMDVPVTFRAVCKYANGQFWEQGKAVDWYPMSRGPFGPKNTTILNATGETFLTITVSKDRGPCFALIWEVSNKGSDIEGQGYWTGLFADFDNLPFPQYAVNVPAPDNPDVAYGTQVTLTATVLTGRDPLTQLPTTPIPNATVYWHADPADKVTFSLPTGPVSTLPHDEFPTVTDSSGMTSVRVSSAANEAFSATIWAEIHSRDTGTAIESDPPVTLEFGAEQKPQIVVTSGLAPANLYTNIPLTATYSGPADQMPPQVEFFADYGADTEHFAQFTPSSIADINAGGQAVTSFLGYGENWYVNVNVYARPLETPGFPPPTDFTLVPALLTLNSASQLPQGTVLSVVPLDGDPLSLDAWHLLTATFTNLDGTPVKSGSGDTEWDGNIHWSPLPQEDPNLTWLTTDPTPADANGAATNAIKCSADLHQITVTASAYANNGSLLTSRILPLTFQQLVRFEDQGNIAVDFDDDSDQLQLNTPQGITATYTDSNGNLVDGAWITWTAFPADRVKFDKEKTQTASCVATNTVTVSGQTEIEVYVSATSPNAKTGANDYGMTTQVFEQEVDALIIYLPPGEPEPLTLYDPHDVDAAYTGPKTLQQVQWSVDPNLYPHNTIDFSPNPSQVTNQGNNKYTTNTNITVKGRDAPIDVTVYARSTDPNNFVAGETEHPLRFKAKGTQPPAGNTIVVTSPDGNPLSAGANDWHILQATYTDPNGNGIPNATLNWSPTNQAGTAIVPGPPTDANGVTTTAINVASPQGVTVTASDNTGALGSLSLTFQAGTVKLPGQGTMQIVFTDATPPYGLNKKYELTVTYTEGDGGLAPDGTQIFWHAFPPDKLTFDRTMTTVTGGQGQSTNYVTAIGDAGIDNAVISTTHFNEDLGVNDHSEPNLVVNFMAKPTLIGILLDKAYAQTPQGTHVKPNNPKQNIKCQVQVEHQQGVQTIMLVTNPTSPGEKMFKDDGSGNYLDIDPSTGNYIVKTDNNSVGTFLVGSDGFTLFDLNAQWNSQTLPAPAKLVLATNRQQVNPVVPKPIVPTLNGGTMLQIPPAPAPTFKVKIPNSRYVSSGTTVAILLNDRLVYDGVADPALNAGVDVAYAALNLTTANNLVYVAGTALESDQLTFTATGAPQTGPNTGGVSRSLTAPSIGVQSGQTIGPKDIINGGLPVVIQKYDNVTPNVDVITLYFYLSGTDALTATPVTNIVPVVYLVTSDTSFPLTLLLPQQYAAGYANGQLQADYKVVGNTTRWSQLSSTYPLNTTF